MLSNGTDESNKKRTGNGPAFTLTIAVLQRGGMKCL